MNTGDYKSLFDIPRNIYAIRPLNKDCDVCHAEVNKEWEVEE